MQIVIEIPEKVYNALTHKEFDASLVVEEMRKSIANGIPLPEGHGRLKDIDAIIDTLDSSDRDIYVKECLEEDTPTIIPADTGSEEE